MLQALEYLRRGWAIFPLAPGTKDKPLVKWGEFQTRLPTEAEVTEWWTKWPDANIAIATGPVSDVAVLDLEHDGLEQIDCNSNTIALTGKGKHGYFRFPKGLRNAAAIGDLKGFDLRGEGGYAVLPPSVHPDGRKYLWLQGPSQELSEFPPELLTHIDNLQLRSKTLSPDWVKDALESLGEGNRNDTFARIIGKLHHSGLDKGTIWSLLLPHARRVNFSDAELNTVLQSITRYATNEVSANASASSVESFLSGSEPVSWLCEGIIADGTLGFVAGLPEVSKTWVTMDLAVECARGGGLWLGLFPVRSARVLYVDQERHRSETQRRFQGILNEKGLSGANLKDSLFIKSGTTTRLNLDDSYRAFHQELLEIRPELIIVDSFATFTTSDENDRMTAQKVIERLKEIRSEFGCAILMIDHENKSAFSDGVDGIAPNYGRMVGSIGKAAAAELILTVRRYDLNTCTVYNTKNTMAPRVPSFNVHVVDTAKGIKVFGEMGKK